MSEFIQPGPSTHGFTPAPHAGLDAAGAHLDADQLTAFAEGALPEHEHAAALSHLADCARCRDIVFLAQAAAPQPEPAVAEPRVSLWRSIFGSGLRSRLWVLGATAALACVLVLAVVLPSWQHRLSTRSADAVATNAPPKEVPVAPPTVAPAPQAAVMAKQAPSRPQSLPQVAREFEPKAVPHNDVNTIPPKPGDLALNNLGQSPPRYFVPNQQMTQNTLAQGQVAQRFTVDGAPAPTPQVAAAAQPALPLVAAAPPPPPPPVAGTAAAVSSVNGGVAVADAAPEAPKLTGDKVITDSPLDLSADNVSAYTLQSRPLRTVNDLPSHQNAVSVVEHAGRTLALDTEGNLYLSTDSGHQWSFVFRDWQGKAVRLAVASPPEPALTRSRGLKDTVDDAEAESSAASDQPANAKQKRAEPPSRPPFQLITEDGKVWTSEDGSRWKEK